MKQAWIPLLLYLAMQVPVWMVGMNLAPSEKEGGGISPLRTHVFGQMALWGLVQVLAVPLIQLRQSFDVLFWLFLGASLALCATGTYRWLKNRRRLLWPSPRAYLKSLSWLGIVLLVLIVAVVALQVGAYFFERHLDEDDARWLAEANDALEYGQMITRNPSTGEYLGRFIYRKDAVSPWPMFLAILARLLGQGSAVVAHTLYAPVALLLSYGVYALIARELFEKPEARLTFVLSVAVINLFYAGTVYTQSVFTLVRIWQGKATVAGIIIPLLAYLFIRLNKYDRPSDWRLLVVCGFGSCLMSGMGISMSGIMIGVYGLYSLLAYRRWRRVGYWLAAMAPIAAYTLLYFN